MKRFTSLIFGLLVSLSAGASIIGETVKGTTDYSVELKIIDEGDGSVEQGVTSAQAGLNFWYRREGAVITNFATEGDLTALNDAHSDEDFLHIDDGVYRVDLPDAAVASGADYVYVGGTATGMIVIGGRVKLTDVDMNDSVRAGMTALPNAAADAAGGLPISDAGGLDLDGLNTNVNDIETDTGTTLPGILGTPADLGGGATLADNLSDIEGQTDDIGVAGAGLTESGGTGDQFTAQPWNASWDTEVESEAQDALVANHLDHAFAADYDPASPPGVATALFNELIESDAGVSRFTVNALEQGPSGSGASAESIADAVWDELLSGHTTAGSAGDALGVDVPAILADTAAIPTFPTNFSDLDIEVTTGHVDVGYWNGTAISTALETSADIADAVLDEDLTAHQTTGSLGAAIGDGDAGAGMTESGGTGDHLTAQPWNAAWDAEAQSESADAMAAIYLDQLFANAYNSASPDGNAAAFLNELTENDSGDTRFTINALEQGPSGSGASAASIADAVWTETLADHSGGAGSTAEALDDATTGGGLDAAGVRAAVGLASANLDTQLSTIDTEVGTAQADLDILTGTDGATLATAQANYAPATAAAVAALNDLSQAEAQTAAAAALTAYDPPTRTELTADVNSLPTASEIVTAVLAGQVEDQGTGYDLQCALATLLAYAAGDVSTSSGTSTYQDPSGTENRIVGTVSGANRSSITITCP